MRIVWSQVLVDAKDRDWRVVGKFLPSTTTLKLAADIRQPLWICSFWNVRSFGLFILRTQFAYGLLLTTCGANDFFKLLQALPESTKRAVELFSILMGILRDSIFSRSLCIVAIMLPSPLLQSDSYHPKNLSKKFRKSLDWGSSSTVFTDFFLFLWGTNDLTNHSYYRFNH